MMGAVGVDAEGNKNPLCVVEGATENATTVQALLDNLIERGLDPAVCRLFIVDGAKALTKAIRRVLRQAWEMADAEKAERRLRNRPVGSKSRPQGCPGASSRGWTRS